MKRLVTTTLASTLAAALVGAAPVQAQHQETRPVTTQSKGTVLLVASSTNRLELKGGKVVPTGYFLDELAVPAQYLIAHGYDVVVATPDGNTPAMDAHSNHPALFGNDPAALQQALGFVLTHPTMQKPRRLADVVREGLGGYAAVYVPGGHAPMNDLMQDPDLGRILRAFHAAGTPTALLCHGPIATLAALPQAAAFRQALVAGDAAAAKTTGQGWQYAGYRMTIYSNSEEQPIQRDVLHGDLQFYVADALRAAGGRVEHGPDNDPFVVQDRELITGQNPSSDHRIAETLVRVLDERAGRRADAAGAGARQ
jgi:putative intracellular protease/amidase